MLNPKPQQECSESTSEPWLNGSRKGKSKQLKPRQDKGDTTLNPTRGNRLSQLELPLFTLVSAVGDNPKTSQDKSPSSKKNTRKRKSSAKSGEDSTSKGKNLQPYWNESCLEMSQQLWSLTKIGLPDLDLIGLTGSAESLDAQSWFDRETNLSPEAEMVEDILAILDCFSSRLYGLGKYKNQSKKDKSLSQSGVEETVE
jgi:hypothetical protein